jgi:hypothetical protein
MTILPTYVKVFLKNLSHPFRPMFSQMISYGSGALVIVAPSSLKDVPFFPHKHILSKQDLLRLHRFILAKEWLKVTKTTFVFS